MRVVVRRLSGMAILAALLAGGCGSDRQPEQGQQAQASPTAVATEAPVSTPTPAPTPSPMPTPKPTPTPVPTSAPIDPPEPIPIEVPEGWELVWHDEFDGEEIDRTNWTYDIGGWGWGNGEAQYYTSRPENSRVENGLLVIEARQERHEGSYFTSARMLTKGLREFKYGRFEARLKVPAGAGLWPAFWMLGAHFDRHSEDPANHWPFVGEIDIMEYIGREPDLIFGTLHGPGYAGAIGFTKWFRQDYDIADDFHTYAIEWNEEGISWFYDGEHYNTLTRDVVGNREWVFDHEFFFILNLAVGGHFPGPIGLDVEFPVNLYVDYVRVYQPVAESASEA